MDVEINFMFYFFVCALREQFFLLVSRSNERMNQSEEKWKSNEWKTLMLATTTNDDEEQKENEKRNQGITVRLKSFFFISSCINLLMSACFRLSFFLSSDVFFYHFSRNFVYKSVATQAAVAFDFDDAFRDLMIHRSHFISIPRNVQMYQSRVARGIRICVPHR